MLYFVILTILRLAHLILIDCVCQYMVERTKFVKYGFFQKAKIAATLCGEDTLGALDEEIKVGI